MTTFLQAKGDVAGRANHRSGSCCEKKDVGDDQCHQKVLPVFPFIDVLSS